MHLGKHMEHTHKSPISSGWHHTSRQHPCCQQYSDHLAPAAPPHLPLCQYKPSHFPGQCENDGKLDLGTDPAENLPFFFFLGIIFNLDPFPDLAQSMTTQRLCQHKEAI